MAKKKKGYGGPDSYYGFRRDYPGESNQYTRQGKRVRKEKALRITGICLVFCALFVVSYFVMSVMIDISNRPIIDPTQEIQQGVQNITQEEQTTEPVQAEQKALKAVWVSDSVLKSEDSVNSFIEKVASQGINSVVIDFKRENGTLAYTSTATDAAKIGSDKKVVADLSKKLELFKQANMSVVARVCCFKDPLAPVELREGAVHYLNTDGLWYNNYVESGGEPWLNPYSQVAQDYLISIIKEVNAMGVDSIMLDYVQFPSGYALNLATFDGESEGAGRNETLLKFIDSVKSTVGRDKTVIVSMTGDGALNGNSQYYDGSLMDSDASVVAPDLRFSNLRAIKVGETEFASPAAQQVEFITAAGDQLSKRATIGGRTQTVMPWIEASSQTSQTLSEQLAALENSGITSYILYNSSSSY